MRNDQRIEYVPGDWLPIHNFPNYEINDLGRVRERRTGEIVKPKQNKYLLEVRLYDTNGNVHLVNVKDLMVWTFCSAPDRGFEVYFINGDITDMRPDNIGWEFPRRYDNKRVMIRGTGEIFNSLGEYCDITGESVRDAKRSASNPGRLVTRHCHQLEFVDWED